MATSSNQPPPSFLKIPISEVGLEGNTPGKYRIDERIPGTGIPGVWKETPQEKADLLYLGLEALGTLGISGLSLGFFLLFFCSFLLWGDPGRGFWRSAAPDVGKERRIPVVFSEFYIYVTRKYRLIQITERILHILHGYDVKKQIKSN